MKEQFSKSIFLQNLRTVSDDRIIYSSGKKIVENFHHIQKYEGISRAISAHKDIERCIKNRVLGIDDNVSQEKWISLTKGGLPKKIISDREFSILVSSPGGKQGLLTVVAYYRLYHLPVKEDFTSVTSPGSFLDCNELCDDIVSHFDLDQRFEVDKYQESFLFPTSKAGASGPKAMGETAYSDLAALIDSQVCRAVTGLARLVHTSEKFKELLGAMNESISKISRTGITTRLHLLSEGGGKTRIICIPDIWSQMALKPLHEFFMKCLKSMPGDGTFSHDSVATQLRTITKSQGMICYDLTTVTDRLPVSLQCKLVSKLTNEETAYWWRALITERDFHYKDRVMRYAVGQPMGLLSSWPVMALTHHAIIQYALRNVEDKTYFVIGDDMAISSEEGALEYRRIIESIGVEINFSKSIQTKETMSGEIAKRVFSHGLEISPIPPRVLLEATGSDIHFLEFLKVLESRANLSSESPRFITDESSTRLFKKSRSWTSPGVHIFMSLPFKLPSSNTSTPITGVIDMWEGIYGANHRFDQYISTKAAMKIVEIDSKIKPTYSGSPSCDSVLVELYKSEVKKQLKYIMTLYNLPTHYDDVSPPSPSETMMEILSRPDPNDMKVFLHKTQIREQKALTLMEEFWKSMTYKDPHQVLTEKMKSLETS